jgi:hypothetical protein
MTVKLGKETALFNFQITFINKYINPRGLHELGNIYSLIIVIFPSDTPCRASSLYHTRRAGQNPWEPLDLRGLSQMCTSFQQIMAPPPPPCFLPMRHLKHINIMALAGDFHE